MPRLIEMMQERARVTASIREMMDQAEGRQMTGEENEALRRAEGEFDALNERIIAEERQLERERAEGERMEQRPAPGANGQMQAFAAALTGGQRQIDEYRDVYRASFTLGDDDQAGSLTAPMEFREQLIKEVDDLVFMRRLSRVLPPIGASQTIGFPQRVNAATDAEWVAEIARAPEEDTLSYKRREFKPKRMAKRILLSRALVHHAPLATSAVQAEMAYSIASTQENAYMMGDGADKPLGIFVASVDGIPTSRDISDGNTATGVTYDGLINAKYSLKQQYQQRAQWIMHRELIRDLAKIKDGEDRYIWQPSVASGVPDRLLGFAVNMSEFAPNTFTAGKYAAVLGDFRHYWIVDAQTLTVQVLRELYAETNQIAYLYNYSGDGAPVLGEAFARVKLGA